MVVVMMTLMCLVQAVRESEQLSSMLPEVQRFITATNDKLETLTKEEKMTAFVRRKVHKAINERTQEVADKIVKQIQEYAETLHQQVRKWKIHNWEP